MQLTRPKSPQFAAERQRGMATIFHALKRRDARVVTLKTVAVLLLTGALSNSAFAQDYLGNLSSNHLAPNSLSNPYGAGNPYNPNSPTNPFSTNGSRYSDQSANNPYATHAPKLYDQDGNYRGRLSSNPYDPDSVSNPYGKYGNRFSPDSINNKFGAGNPYSQSSPQNPYGKGMKVFGGGE